MNSVFDSYTTALNSELKKATGCTEPIALAYCAAYARDVLGEFPDSVVVRCSGNIIKNVKSVTVPHTDGQKGIETAVLAGLLCGKSNKKLEVLSDFSRENVEKLSVLLSDKAKLIRVKPLDTDKTLHVIIEVKKGEDELSVELVDWHTNIGRVVKNGEIIKENEADKASTRTNDVTGWSVKSILEYADKVELKLVRESLETQIECNSAIAKAGLEENWGTTLGKIILGGESSNKRYKASAVAGSDARMSGCPLPVVINSGSGNQGLTVSLPVIEYAKAKGVEHDRLLRALCVSNLIALYQKAPIGRLSAFCGAVSAATAAVCGIAWLDGADENTISLLISNSIATVGGMVCDGAKPSCSAKISTALDSAFTAYDMAKAGRGFAPGEGIVKDNADKTILSVGTMASKGMLGTDKVILELMTSEE